LLRDLSAYSSVPLLEQDTLLIFDEIQACEEAMTSLKYFTEDHPRIHIAAAGSLLGITLHRKRHAFPVGKIELQRMFPMDFEEVLLAKKSESTIAVIRESIELNRECPLHHSFLEQFYTFLAVGGMPQVVKEFLETEDYNLVSARQKNLLDTYIADMAKYASAHETVKIMAAYNSIPAQLAKENKKFQYKVIQPGGRSSMFQTAIDWLKASGLVYPCVRTSGGTAPIMARSEPDFFKLYLNDTGLLFARYGFSPAVAIQNPASWFPVKGAMIENAVAVCLANLNYPLYYWESQGKAEVDFLMQTKSGDIIPVEVKSSEHVRSKSLQQFMKQYTPPWAYRISTKNFGFENQIKSIPLYAMNFAFSV
jgi:uncharacterized protein